MKIKEQKMFPEGIVKVSQLIFVCEKKKNKNAKGDENRRDGLKNPKRHREKPTEEHRKHFGSGGFAGEKRHRNGGGPPKKDEKRQAERG